MTPVTTVIALLAALLAGQLSGPQSRLVRIAAVMIVLMAIGTFGWFVPTIIRLQSASVLAIRADEAKKTASLWASLNWVRAAWFCAAFGIIIRAVYVGHSKASAPRQLDNVTNAVICGNLTRTVLQTRLASRSNVGTTTATEFE